MSDRCRHERNSWVMAGGYLLWCYRCGAVLQMEVGVGGCWRVPGAKWIKPVGTDGENPYGKLIFRAQEANRG